MSGMNNGNLPLVGSAVPLQDDPPIVASFRVQKKLEQCYQWFLAQEDITSAINLLQVITRLADNRLQLVETMLQAAQEEQAAAMIGGQ